MQAPYEKMIFGREDELKRYSQIIDEFTSNQYDLPVVVLVKGNGGIGKSTLELAFREEISDYKNILYSRIDWENHKDQFIESSIQPGLPLSKQYLKLLSEAINSIHNTPWYLKYLGTGQPLPKYNNALEQEGILRSKIINQIEVEPDTKTIIEKIASFTKRNSVSLVISALTKDFAGFAQIFAQEALTATEEPFKQFIQSLKTLLTPEEIASLDSAFALVDALGDDLRDLADRQRLIMTLDTYEVVHSYDSLTRRIIHRAGNNCMWVIVGRKDLFEAQNTIDGYRTGYLEDRDRLYRVHNFDVNQLSNLAIQEWFSSQGATRPLTNEVLEAIRRITRGIPLALECAYILWQNGDDLTQIDVDESASHADIVRHMVQRYNRHCTDEKTRKNLMIVAFADGNLSVLKSCLLALDPEIEDIVNFIHELGLNYSAVYAEEYRLHSDPAFFYQKEMKLKLQEEWIRPVLDAAIETYCSQLIQIEQDADTLYKRLNESKWQEIVLKLTEIFFWKNDQSGWHWLVLRWLEAIAFNTTFSGQLVSLVEEKCDPYISDYGKTRLNLMAEYSGVGDYFYAPETMSAQLIEELKSWKKRKWLDDSWLDDSFYKQREAIYRWQRAKFYLNQKALDLAHKEIEAAMKNTPASDPALKKLIAESIREIGWEFNNQKKDKIAQKLFQASTVYDPDDRWAWQQYAMASCFLKDYDTALEANGQLLVRYKDFAKGHSSRSWILREKGDSKDALVSAKKGVELDPENYIIQKMHIDCLVACYRFEDAIECITKILDEQNWSVKENCLLRFSRSSCYDALNPPRLKAGIEDYTFVINLTEAPVEHKTQALVNRGATFGQLDPPRFQDALDDYSRVIEKMPDAPVDQIVRALVNRGVTFGLLDPPRLQDALDDFSRVIEKMPDAPVDQIVRALVNRGVTFGQLDPPRFQDALDDYSRVIEKMPDAPVDQVARALFNRGVTFGLLDPPRFQDQIDDYSRVIEKMPDAPVDQVARALVNRGGTFGKLDPPRFQDQIDDCSRVIEKMPDAPVDQVALALVSRGHTFGQLDPPRFQDALDDYSRTIEKMPDAPVDQLAIALFNRGVTFGLLDPPRFQDQIDDYSRVIEKMPDAPVDQVARALVNRGGTFGLLDPPRFQDEIDDYSRVIEKMPDAPVDQVAIALVNRGITFGKLDPPRFQDALDDYSRVIEKMPDAPVDQLAIALVNRSDFYLKQEDPDSAINDSTQVIETLKDIPTEYIAVSLMNRSEAYYLRQKYELARIDIRKAISMNVLEQHNLQVAQKLLAKVESEMSN